MAWINNTGMSAKDARRWGNDGLSQMRKDNHYKEQENRSERASNEKRIKELEGQVAKQKAAPSKATPSKPKAEKKEEPVENPLAEMRESYDPYEYGEMLRSRHEDARGDSAYNPEAGVNNENGAGDFMNDYKINIQESMADAGVETRGPDSLQAPNTTDDDDKDDEVSYNV
jgi:hypothetical protein